MPLTVSIQEIKKIEILLWEGHKNYVFIHCQENKSRSVVFLSIYLYFSGKSPDIASALSLTHSKLSIP